jgi:predicted SAM-dependent methyltransferase
MGLFGLEGRGWLMQQKYRVKKLNDGRAMLNLGCGLRVNWEWTNVDFSALAILAHHKLIGKGLRRVGLLTEERYERISRVEPDVVVCDLRKGIPFDDDTFDVVYHSHLLEHIDRGMAPFFLRECYRVLKNNGIIRIVVPDLQVIVNRYVSSIAKLETGDQSGIVDYRRSIYQLFDQMVRRQPSGTTKQRPWVQIIERFLRGDAARVGEVHRWMYDRYSLSEVLLGGGFKNIRVEQPSTSRIRGWSHFNLDTNEDGSVYKPDSVYMEGMKLSQREQEIYNHANPVYGGTVRTTAGVDSDTNCRR